MATTDWQIPTGKEITGATYIKDTDDKIAATIEDLVDWCNNANGTYNDWTLTGLRTDFVDVNTAQTITAVKTIDTLGAVDFTGGELRIGGVAVTSTAAELNILDGVTATATELNTLDGITATTSEINQLSGYTVPVSGEYSPTISNFTNLDSASSQSAYYIRVGDIVMCTVRVLFNPTATSTETTFTISLPVASTLAAGETALNGTVVTDDGSASGYYTSGRIRAIGVLALVSFISSSTGNGVATCHFTYKIT